MKFNHSLCIAHASQHRGEVGFEMAVVSSAGVDTIQSLHSSTDSAQQPLSILKDIHDSVAVSAINPDHVVETSRSDIRGDTHAPAAHRDRTGSMRQRVGSRRASFSEFSQYSNIFTSASGIPPISQVVLENTTVDTSDQADSSVLQSIPQHNDADESASTAQSTAHSMTAPAAVHKPAHGLLRWVQAGGVWMYFSIFMAYPTAQIIRIMSDIYVRWWTEKEFFSSQQKNLEVYSWLVGGWVCSTPFCFPH
jgi:hypothetical protein